MNYIRPAPEEEPPGGEFVNKVARAKPTGEQKEADPMDDDDNFTGDADNPPGLFDDDVDESPDPPDMSQLGGESKTSVAPEDLPTPEALSDAPELLSSLSPDIAGAGADAAASAAAAATTAATAATTTVATGVAGDAAIANFWNPLGWVLGAAALGTGIYSAVEAGIAGAGADAAGKAALISGSRKLPASPQFAGHYIVPVRDALQ